MRAFRVGITLIVFALILLTGIYLLRSNSAQASQPQVLAAVQGAADDLDMSILDKINKVRVEAGVQKLSYSQPMEELTTDRVVDMSVAQYYSHTSPDGYTFAHKIHDFDKTSQRSCENLQLQIGGSWQEAVSAWVDSPAHYRCLTDPRLNRGAGSVTVYEEVSYDDSDNTEQMFVFAFIATN